MPFANLAMPAKLMFKGVKGVTSSHRPAAFRLGDSGRFDGNCFAHLFKGCPANYYLLTDFVHLAMPMC